MLAQRRYEVAPAVVRRNRKRKRIGVLGRLMRNPMNCVFLFAVAVTFMLSVYVGAYARAMENGYRKTDLVLCLKDLRQRNESIRLDLEGRRQPDAIAEFAVQNGMEQSEKIAYLKPVSQSHIAHNIDTGSAR